MRFGDIPGLEETKTHLRSTVAAGKVAHAQLFAGSPAAPGLAMAAAFASYLLCENKGTDVCGECSACAKTLKHIHPDVQYVFPTAGTSKIPRKDASSSKFLKEWRSFLEHTPFAPLEVFTREQGAEDKLAMIPVEESRDIIKNLSLKPFEADIKVVVIWLPEKMIAAGANALLKVLEEPPGNSVFILASNDPEALLGTILSRTQRLYIRPFSDEEIVNELKRLSTEEVKAKRVAHLAEGNLFLARQLLEDAADETHAWFQDWMRSCFTGAFQQMVQLADEFGAMSKAVRTHVLQYGLGMMRETVIIQPAGDLSRLEGEDQTFASNFSKVLSVNKVSDIMNALDESIYHLERNANPKIEFLNLSLTIAQTFKTNNEE